MFVITLLLSFFYFAALFLLSIGILKLKKPPATANPRQISVIIAARNEEENITAVLEKLLNQNYPSDKYEIIVVDDRSEDKTSLLVKEFTGDKDVSASGKQLTLLEIPAGESGGKKRALARGISQARYPLLAFTDADCLPSPEWLSEINRHFSSSEEREQTRAKNCENNEQVLCDRHKRKERTDILAGYSPLLSRKDSFLSKLKNLERLSIFAVTAGSMGWNYGLTCTARNLAYRRSLYDKVKGFSGLENIPSGDDDLMLQRMSPHAGGMNFMFTPGSVVPSFDNKSLSGQINLETRRASKWRLYPLPVQIGTALVFLYYAFFLLMFGFFLVSKINLQGFLLLLMIKIIAELTVLIPVMKKLRCMPYLAYYPAIFIFHLPYFLFFALKGTFGKYRWK